MGRPCASLTIKFEARDEVATWFRDLRTAGQFPPGAGVRRADALDFAGKRAEPDSYILSTDPGAGEWLVPPNWTDDEGKASCPECHGFGYHEDGSEEGSECTTCEGNGVATREAAETFLEESR
jgi:hypothetical protein